MRRPHAPALPSGPWNDSTLANWACRLCKYSNPDDEDICCRQCGTAKR